MPSSASGSATPSIATVVTIDPYSGLRVTTLVVLPIRVIDPYSGLTQTAVHPLQDYDLLVAHVETEYNRRALEIYRAALVELILGTTNPVLLCWAIRNRAIGLVIQAIRTCMMEYVQVGSVAF